MFYNSLIERHDVVGESLTVAQGEGCEGAVGQLLLQQLDQRRFSHCFGIFVNQSQDALKQVCADLSFCCC